MELDLQSLFGLHHAELYSLAKTPQSPSPAFGFIYEGAIAQLRYADDITLWPPGAIVVS